MEIAVIIAIAVLLLVGVALGRWMLGIYLLLAEIKKCNKLMEEMLAVNKENGKISHYVGKSVTDLLARIG